MERLRLTFFFRLGQTVCWLQPNGPRYVVTARVYAEGEWPAGYTAGAPTSATTDPQCLYLLRNPANILGEFWAKERDLYVAWGGQG